MLRDPNLIPLSQQHQHALALCVRIEREPKTKPEETVRWNSEIDRIFASEIRFHFEAEERLLFPAAGKYPEMGPLVNELLAEHDLLRGYFERASRGDLVAADLTAFGTTLAAHIRKEERQLFEDCQRLMPGGELSRIGAGMAQYFKSTPGANCGLA